MLGRAVLRRASGGIVTPQQSAYVRGALDLTTEQTRRRDRPAAQSGRTPPRAWRKVTRRRAARRRRQGRTRFRRRARPRRRRPDDHLRLRPGSVHLGRQGPLRSRRIAALLRSSICRASTATSCCRRKPAATCSFRPVPTTRKWPSTPCANWHAMGYGIATMRWGTGGLPVRSARTDAAQPDGLQGRHQQSVDRETGADESVRVGQRTPMRRG
jgi:hypothetical protein